MNSLIAKTIYNYLYSAKGFSIFLDVEKYKDYMHVSDFCSAIEIVLRTGMFNNEDYNISLKDPCKTSHVLSLIDKVYESTYKPKYYGLEPSKFIQFHPETDYLGNHRVSNNKFVEATRGLWYPKVHVFEGIKMVFKELDNFSKENYNPLKYLDQIKENNINIKQYYPQNAI